MSEVPLSPNLWAEDPMQFDGSSNGFLPSFRIMQINQFPFGDITPLFSVDDRQDDLWEVGRTWINPINVQIEPLREPQEVSTILYQEVARKPKPFDKKLLKTRCFKKEIDECKECCICLQSFKKTMKIKTLPCAHQFHLRCIDKWFKKVQSCPLCRSTFDQ